MYRTAYNTTESPVVVSDDGRVIGGLDWGTVETTDEYARQALAANLLTVQDEPDEDQKASMNPRALEAHERTAEIRERAEAAKNLDKDTLMDVAEDAGYDVEGGVGVRELRETVAEDIEIKLPSKTKRRA